MLKIFGYAGSILFGPILAYRAIEYLPETGDSFKHQLRHKFKWGTGGLVTHFTNMNGERIVGLRCWTCDKIFDEPEHPDSKEEPLDRVSRLYHKYWYERYGPKDHDSYLQWLEKQKNWRAEEIQLRQDAHNHLLVTCTQAK